MLKNRLLFNEIANFTGKLMQTYEGNGMRKGWNVKF